MPPEFEGEEDIEIEDGEFSFDEREEAIRLLEELMAHAAKQSITESGKRHAPPPPEEAPAPEGELDIAVEEEPVDAEPSEADLMALLGG